jgi:hypothetical protein
MVAGMVGDQAAQWGGPSVVSARIPAAGLTAHGGVPL